MTGLYDDIGQNYAGQRQGDHRIAAAIEKALAGCEFVLNVGAGTGSYEPRSLTVVAVEPSRTMIDQRPKNAAPAIQARAEALPFSDASFDAVLAILTVHHWSDQAKGLAELARVSRSRVVNLTIDVEVCAKFRFFDYIPELLRIDRNIFPPISRFADTFYVVETLPVPIPADCRDGFLVAYWQRPPAYLDPLFEKASLLFPRLVMWAHSRRSSARTSMQVSGSSGTLSSSICWSSPGVSRVRHFDTRTDCRKRRGGGYQPCHQDNRTT